MVLLKDYMEAWLETYAKMKYPGKVVAIVKPQPREVPRVEVPMVEVPQLAPGEVLIINYVEPEDEPREPAPGTSSQ